MVIGVLVDSFILEGGLSSIYFPPIASIIIIIIFRIVAFVVLRIRVLLVPKIIVVGLRTAGSFSLLCLLLPPPLLLGTLDILGRGTPGRRTTSISPPSPLGALLGLPLAPSPLK